MENYDPQAIVVTFGPVLIRGYASGTFVKASQETDAFSDIVGNQGDVVRVRSRDNRGNVEITILASSVTNDQLSAIHLEDKEFGVLAKPLLIKDLKGTTLISAKDCYITKFPEVEYGDDGGNRTWMIRCASLNQYVGGKIDS